MIRWFLNRQMKAYEREFNYDMGYARDILDTGLGAFWTFSRILSISSYRKEAPLDAWYAAKIAATIAADCGPCTQLVVDMAALDGVSTTNLRAILANDEQGMTPDAALGASRAGVPSAPDGGFAGVSRRQVPIGLWTRLHAGACGWCFSSGSAQRIARLTRAHAFTTFRPGAFHR
jgi:hypothetical protein